VSNVTRIRVDIAGQSREVVVGAFAQIAAKRRYGMDALRDGDPEPVLYGVWIELDGPRPPAERSIDIEDPKHPFNAWLASVEGFELVQTEGDPDDEDPTPAESSGSSLVSPPTSE
jgi:hypothetical protein